MEMLFPNTEVKMKMIDTILNGVPTAVGGIFMLVTKLGTTLLLLFSVFTFWPSLHDQPASLDQAALVALLVGLGGLGAFLLRQHSKYKNRKKRFMKQLTENLYFKNLDNNAGVLRHLIDAYEEEECKETILAYYNLLIANYALSLSQLDKNIEMWFEENYNCLLDLEMQDALNKLIYFGLAVKVKGLHKAKILSEVNQQIYSLWNNCFNY